VPDPLASLREEIALANRILVHEGILDAFGHVSARHPTDPSRFLLSRYLAPELVEPDDIREFNVADAEPVRAGERHYSERVIHSCIYEARPDVMAVCHHHAPAVLAFAIAKAELVPVFHLGAAMGEKVAYWDSQDDFGDTSLLVTKIAEGRSLARALGRHSTVLMGRHGATVAGNSVREVAFRTVYSCRNAELQIQAKLLGQVYSLTPGEARMAGSHNTRSGPLGRAWDSWVRRLHKAGDFPKTGATKTRKRPARRAAKLSLAQKRRGKRSRKN
jgi:ribulose-5-phosphate 4-epimerase/fuculose-1-phosphate aldolase